MPDDLTPDRFTVSKHALERWRQRVHPYASAEEVARAAAGCRAPTKAERRRFARLGIGARAGTCVVVHEETRAALLLSPREDGAGYTVVTVLSVGLQWLREELEQGIRRHFIYVGLRKKKRRSRGRRYAG